MLTGIDAEIETSTMHETSTEVSALSEQTGRLSVVQCFDDAYTALNVRAFQS